MRRRRVVGSDLEHARRAGGRGASGFALAFKADALRVGTAIDGVDAPRRGGRRRRRRQPLDWAMTQNNLGGTLTILGEREGGTERLEQAVAAHTEALKERTHEWVPLDWATAQSNLGAALATLGEREGGTERTRLEQAVAAFTEALRPWPPSSSNAPASGCPSPGLRRGAISAAPSSSYVSGAERFERSYD